MARTVLGRLDNLEMSLQNLLETKNPNKEMLRRIERIEAFLGVNFDEESASPEDADDEESLGDVECLFRIARFTPTSGKKKDKKTYLYFFHYETRESRWGNIPSEAIAFRSRAEAAKVVSILGKLKLRAKYAIEQVELEDDE